MSFEIADIYTLLALNQQSLDSVLSTKIWFTIIDNLQMKHGLNPNAIHVGENNLTVVSLTSRITLLEES